MEKIKHNIEPKTELLYKIVVVGDIGTGKTSIIKRYVHNLFNSNYKSTIGVDFALKVLNWDDNTIIRLQLWDIAGQERFTNMTRVYYKEAVAALIVFDVTRLSTFETVKKWIEDINNKIKLPDNSNIPIVLVANKIDLINKSEGWGKSEIELTDYCKENNIIFCCETSAKDNLNIDLAYKTLVNFILEKFTIKPEIKNDNLIKLGNPSQDEKSSCC